MSVSSHQNSPHPGLPLNPQRLPNSAGNFSSVITEPGMNDRIRRLRRQSVETKPSISIERALIETEFYQQYETTYPVPILRARFFLELCRRKTIYIGDDELIVGERGPAPKAVPTYPELNCHTAEDFCVLNSREKQRYLVDPDDIRRYQKDVIPYWQGRTMRDRIFNLVPEAWKRAYEAGLFTEFMEQRAPGHTALDGKIYQRGLEDFKADITRRKAELESDPKARPRIHQLEAMAIACDALILLARRHADLADAMAETCEDRVRAKELKTIAQVCRRVPAQAPRTFHEAIQMYWFLHLGTITELNGWDAMNPGHFDQHLYPFYRDQIASGTLTREQARELLSCFWIKVNNQPAPPKVGITARESGTYNDFTNINIGGLDSQGENAVNDLSYLMLDIIEELHILQPGNSVHISRKTPDDFLDAAIKVIRQGHGYPSVFNADIYVKELRRQGKSLRDAYEGGCSGCIEVGAFGKEAFLLTGYLNVPKCLDITLHNGRDSQTGKRVGLETGDPADFTTFEELYAAFHKQLAYFIRLKMDMSNRIDALFARHVPAPLLSVVIDDCIEKGRDYYDAGPRYNTNYIQCTGLGTVTDSLSVLKYHVFEKHTFPMTELLEACDTNFTNREALRRLILNRTPFFGNDDAYADEIALRVYQDLFTLIDGKPNCKGGHWHLNMLSTTCHIYFGKVLGATPNGRLAGKSISDGTSPSHGCDTSGPGAVLKSLGKLDHTLSGGTLLNLRFLPNLLKRDSDRVKFRQLIRAYFDLGGHHVQFNIVDTATLRAAQKHPEDYRDLLVRMAGYSDYFNDMNIDLQQEIIARTENESF